MERTTRGEDGESTIWFWTSDISFKDYDGDGLIEPVIVYGTWGINGYDDGRVKIIIFYKGKKVAIRHQSSVLDGGRSTEYDAAYESLPKKLKEDLEVKMAAIAKRRNIIM